MTSALNGNTGCAFEDVGKVANTTGSKNIKKMGHNIFHQYERNASVSAKPPIHMNANKSPLQVFVKAKKKINDIYKEIEEYVHETVQFITSLQVETDLIDKGENELFGNYTQKVAGIREVLARDHMKVVFFGRTSNGKSTVINAMLREKILPSGIGHITNCFCQVEGNDCSQAYLMKESSDEKLSVTSIKQLANALCEEKLNESSLVRIFWPRERCNLLRDDVIFVDSPGVDVSTNLDDWIDKHCLNADVFILVVNAESTLTQVEKNFFHTVSQKLSKPNIFILNNRWDASVNEPEFQELVKAQHTERCTTFLTKELKLMNEKETIERIFFVSARETLQARLEEAKGNLPMRGAIADGFQLRYFEFQEFERKFEECISKSAVRTKFEKHTSRGKSLANDMHKVLGNIYDRISIHQNVKLDQKNLLNERIQEIEIEMVYVSREMELKMHNIIEEVKKRVSKTLNDEIWRLDVLINEFNMPFYSEPLMLNIYKKELNSYIEAAIGCNLKGKLSRALALNLETIQRHISDRVHDLISNEKCAKLMNSTTQSQPFEMLYSLNFQNLCADFQEDLEFKFSWGITTMIQRFTGKVKGKNVLNSNLTNRENSYGQILSPITPITSTPRALMPTSIDGITRDPLSEISRIAFTSIGSQSIAGGLILGGIILKTIGWRLLCGVSALYGCVYLYERFSWTNSAKERSFKTQYARYAAKKLKMIVNLTSANCSRQVQQELSKNFDCLYQTVETATNGMKAELEILATQLAELEAKQKYMKLLRNKAIYIHNELNIFENDYIKSK